MNNYAHLLYICILIYQLFTVECTVKNVWWYAADTDNDRPYNFSLKGQVANRLSTILLCSIFPCCLYFLINYSSWLNRSTPQALEFRTPLFPHLVPPAIMVWIFVWKYIFEPFIHSLQHFVLQLSLSTNCCF